MDVGILEAFTYFNGVLRRDSPLKGKFHRAYVQERVRPLWFSHSQSLLEESWLLELLTKIPYALHQTPYLNKHGFVCFLLLRRKFHRAYVQKQVRPFEFFTGRAYWKSLWFLELISVFQSISTSSSYFDGITEQNKLTQYRRSLILLAEWPANYNNACPSVHEISNRR